mmetsp:Transcript_58229/g.173102  ORF Transcript_58229/g.173102 Transcript_58229/m.173102 type:complete len:256 (+) Transcript_58229:2103-2870(+)
MSSCEERLEPPPAKPSAATRHATTATRVTSSSVGPTVSSCASIICAYARWIESSGGGGSCTAVAGVGPRSSSDAISSCCSELAFLVGKPPGQPLPSVTSRASPSSAHFFAACAISLKNGGVPTVRNCGSAASSADPRARRKGWISTAPKPARAILTSCSSITAGWTLPPGHHQRATGLASRGGLYHSFIGSTDGTSTDSSSSSLPTTDGESSRPRVSSHQPGSNQEERLATLERRRSRYADIRPPIDGVRRLERP